jgi:hypothetical protein
MFQERYSKVVVFFNRNKPNFILYQRNILTILQLKRLSVGYTTMANAQQAECGYHNFAKASLRV